MEDYTIEFDNLRLYINGDVEQRKFVEEELEKIEKDKVNNLFPFLIMLTEFGFLCRVEQIGGDEVTTDICNRLNKQFLRQGMYLMPKL